MDYKKLVFLKKLHALIGYVWDVPWDEEWPDAQNRRNSVDFYACVLYDVAHRTVPKEEDYEEVGVYPMGIRLARSLFQGWSSGPLKGALETFCFLVNYFFIRGIPREILEKKSPMPDMREYKEDVLFAMFGLSRTTEQGLPSQARKRVL